MKRILLASAFLALALCASAQLNRVTRLQNARNLVVTSTDGHSDHYMIFPDKSLMLHRKDGVFLLGNDTLRPAQIRSMQVRSMERFALNEDSTSYTPPSIDHGLLAFRCVLRVNQWNTLVVPFSLSGRSVLETFGEGTRLAAVQDLTNEAVVNFSTIDLNTDETVLQADQFYLISPTREPDIAMGKSTAVVYGPARVPGPVYLVPDVVIANGKSFLANQSLRSPNDSVRIRFSGTYKRLDGKLKVSYGPTRPLFVMDDEGHYYTTADSLVVPGFHHWAAETRNIKQTPFRCYIDGVDETSAIVVPMADPARRPSASQSVFDLQGRRVGGAMKAGMYIINGRKVVVR